MESGKRIGKAGPPPPKPRSPGLAFAALYKFETEELVWQDQAACRGANPDLFFPERGASTRKAKSICRECAVREECLDFAIDHSEKFGIWGAKSERERRHIKAVRRATVEVWEND